MNYFCKSKIAALAIVVCIFGISVSNAAIKATEVVTLPTDANLGGGDKVGSNLISATYNGGSGPGIWIVASGGYRLYHNGALLAEDNQAGRARFVPMTFLPGENAISVIGVNGEGAPGIMVQIDDLDKSYYSGSSWKAKSTVSNNLWKNKGRDLSQWGSATILNYANNKMPSGTALNNFAANTQAKWIWTNSENDKNAVLLFTFNIKAEGFGVTTTGGESENIVIAKDSATIRKYLQSNDAVTILIPEGTYDFRQFRNAVTEAKAKGRTWCKTTCTEKNAVTGKYNTFYRITFKANSCSDLTEAGVQIVQENENLQSWSNWIVTKANKSLIGMGRGANLRGASIAVRSNENSGNHIYRNLAIYDVNPHLIEGGDGLETVGTSSNHLKKFWADHISYKWISDGFDMEYVDESTISYLDFDGANDFNCWGTDPYMALVEDAHLTYANNYWHNTYGRVPKVTGEQNGSEVHIYNQYVDKNRFFIAGASGHSANAKAYVRYENSYIDNGNGYLAEIGDNGYVYFSGITYGNSTKKQYRNNGTVTQGAPQMATFTPSYNFEKRDVANLPKDIPNLSGVGGRYGKMPTYDQAFGLSNTAPTVTINANVVSNRVSLNASANNANGSVSKVDFYIGNDIVGSATKAPYQVTIDDVPTGIYSAVAIAFDNNGLYQMSEFKNFEIQGTSEVIVTKCGVGSSSQEINLGDSIVDFCYTWTNAQTVTCEGFPKGVTVDIDNANKKVNISGTPTEAGTFKFTVNAESAKKSGTIIVTNSLESSSSENIESSSSFNTTYFNKLNFEHFQVAKVRIFDMQGKIIYQGNSRPQKMPTCAIVIEYDKFGNILRKQIEKHF